jgi:hypothetical protein
MNIYNLTSAGGKDIFISKLNASGNFVWAKAIGSFDDDYGTSIAVDQSDEKTVYTTGTFIDTVDFDPGIGFYNIISNASDDIFISKLDSAGNFIWAKATGGTNYDLATSIVLDVSGNLYMTGHFFSDSVLFDSTYLTNGSIWYSDIFVAMLGKTIVNGINQVSSSDNVINIFPNPFSNLTTIMFTNIEAKMTSLKIYDISGKLIMTLVDQFLIQGDYSIDWNAENAGDGIYFLQLISGDNIQSRKIIISK